MLYNKFPWMKLPEFPISLHAYENKIQYDKRDLGFIQNKIEQWENSDDENENGAAEFLSKALETYEYVLPEIVI